MSDNARIADLEQQVSFFNDWRRAQAANLKCAADREHKLHTRIAELEAEVRNLLDSAVPHPTEHPTMHAAWKRAQALLKGGAQ